MLFEWALIAIAIGVVALAVNGYSRRRRTAIADVVRDLTTGEVADARRLLRRALREEPVDRAASETAVTTLIWAVRRSLDTLRLHRVVPMAPRASGISPFTAKITDEARGFVSVPLRDIIDDVIDAHDLLELGRADDAEWAEFESVLSWRWMPHLVPPKGADSI